MFFDVTESRLEFSNLTKVGKGYFYKKYFYKEPARLLKGGLSGDDKEGQMHKEDPRTEPCGGHLHAERSVRVDDLARV